ncbi:MAG: UvrD-helicase domain-containing protein [Verrucomicrobiae bacterium]|nr:UvrD-helicase domain-containing protein [Verrucomicrobiae bacterium]
MQFRIADTFTDSLARLTGDEQKSVKMTAFDLQMNPANPGMSFHKLDKAKDKNFWSVRVSSDIRLIVHKTASSLLLCYVDHHDKAYAWAERRRLETHPTTGAAQLVEIRETVQEVIVPVYRQAEIEFPPKPPLFRDRSDKELLGYGVPADWLDEVRVATEDNLLLVAERLPGEAAEALLELATGGKPSIFTKAGPEIDPFEHPDAQRRFRVMTNIEELEQALDYPWDKWTVFLHPEQREFVERSYSGPARVSGSAGTGKTIVALHRAVSLARQHPEARVLLTTFSDPLANALAAKLRRLVGTQPRLAERIDVLSLPAVGARLYQSHHGPVKLAARDVVKSLVVEAAKAVDGHRFAIPFLLSEWEEIVDAWQLESWEDYREVARLGRKTRLPEAQRAVVWSILAQVPGALRERGLITPATLFTTLAKDLAAANHPPYDFAVVDESQDIGIAHLRFFAALGADRPDALFFAGDLGQRIFQQPFSWKSLGVDIRGRSRNLRVNYRTSHQIRQQADRLLGPEVADIDGNIEVRSDTISVFDGPAPEVTITNSEEEESKRVASWIQEGLADGVAPHEIAVIVRSEAQLSRAQGAVELAGADHKLLDGTNDTATGRVSICTMPLSKGLEFRSVAVMACDDEIVPLQDRIETVGDDADLQEVYDTERHLLYVACTRARDKLLITSVAPASEFLDDLRG